MVCWSSRALGSWQVALDTLVRSLHSNWSLRVQYYVAIRQHVPRQHPSTRYNATELKALCTSVSNDGAGGRVTNQAKWAEQIGLSPGAAKWGDMAAKLVAATDTSSSRDELAALLQQASELQKRMSGVVAPGQVGEHDSTVLHEFASVVASMGDTLARAAEGAVGGASMH